MTIKQLLGAVILASLFIVPVTWVMVLIHDWIFAGMIWGFVALVLGLVILGSCLLVGVI